MEKEVKACGVYSFRRIAVIEQVCSIAGRWCFFRNNSQDSRTIKLKGEQRLPALRMWFCGSELEDRQQHEEPVGCTTIRMLVSVLLAGYDINVRDGSRDQAGFRRLFAFGG